MIRKNGIKKHGIELETLPNGFPNYIPETANLPMSNSVNNVTNSTGSQEQVVHSTSTLGKIFRIS